MGREPTDRDLARAKQMQRVKVAREHLSTLSGKLGWLPGWAEEFIVRSYVMFSEWRIESPPAEVVPMAIVAGMGVIFLMWQSPRLQPFMRKWFLHRPVLLGARPKKEWANCVTLITSVVSRAAGTQSKADAPRCHTRASRTTRSTRSRSSRSAQQRTRTSRRLTPRCRT